MGFSTKDVLAVMVVGAVLVFNGIAMTLDKPLDAGTLGMAGIVIGHYFGAGAVTNAVTALGAAAAIATPPPEPLAAPFTGESPDAGGQ